MSVRLLVDLLQARDVHLRTLPRRPRPIDRATLATAIDGVDAVFLACGNVPEQVDFECAVIDQAAQAGVRRIVKLSARGADLEAVARLLALARPDRAAPAGVGRSVGDAAAQLP